MSDIGRLGQSLQDTHDWITIAEMARLGLTALSPGERRDRIEKLLASWPPGAAPTLAGELRSLVREMMKLVECPGCDQATMEEYRAHRTAKERAFARAAELGISL